MAMESYVLGADWKEEFLSPGEVEPVSAGFMEGGGSTWACVEGSVKSAAQRWGAGREASEAERTVHANARRNENAWQSWKMATLPHWEDRRRGIEVVRAGLRRKEWWIVRQKMLLGQIPLCCGLGLYQLSSAGRHWGFLSWDVTKSDLCLRWFIGSPTHWDQVERRARNSGTGKNLAVDGYSVMEIQARESLEMKQTWF